MCFLRLGFCDRCAAKYHGPVTAYVEDRIAQMTANMGHELHEICTSVASVPTRVKEPAL